MNPDWADQEVSTGNSGASIGNADDTAFVDRISRNIHFEWMEVLKRPKIERHVEPGQHTKVKPREDVKNGNQRFLDLCKKMGLTPKIAKH